MPPPVGQDSAAADDSEQASPDAGSGANGCPGVDDDSIVALYTFDEPNDALADTVTPGVDAGIFGPYPQRITIGAGRCGDALLSAHSGGASGTAAVIPSADRFHLSSGSLDFHLRIVDIEHSSGVLSRDALGQVEPGHLAILVLDGRVVLRYQSTTESIHLCSEPIAEGQWIRVGVNWGQQLQLWVNGKLQRVSGLSVRHGQMVHPCVVRSIAGGIDGNSEAWVIGAVGWLATPGTTDAIGLPLAGAIDHLRISSAPRDYADE